MPARFEPDSEPGHTGIQLRERLNFEALLWDISAIFMTVPAAEVDSQIRSSLQRIAETLKLDRAAVLKFSKDRRQIRLTHAYTRTNVMEPNIESVDQTLPWYTEQLRQNDYLLFPCLPHDLPESAISERQYCLRQNLRSLLALSLKVGGQLLGALTFGSCDPDQLWPEALIQRLQILGQIFANALNRQQVEQAAMQNLRMYESLVNSIDGIVWELDIQRFTFTFVSPQAERLLGYPISQWQDEPSFWTNHMHPEDRHWALNFCQEATRAQRDHEFQYRMIAADGRIVWLHDVVSVVVESGEPCKLRGIMVDITQRKKVEQELRESENRFRIIFEEAPIGLVYVDKQFRIARVNRALCQFLGYTAEELQGVMFPDITHPDDVDKDTQQAARLFTGEIQGYQMEKRYLKKSGEIVWGLLTGTVLHDKDGSISNALGMVENITGRKEIEDQLRQAQKMEAFGQLAGGVAHDFNNLLTAINGYSEMTLAELPDDDRLRPNLEEIIKAGDRAASLTRQLLAFSRKQVLRPKVIDLSFVVDDMKKMLRRLIGENIKLVTTVESKLGKVLADPGQIEQIIMNLAVNARDAMLKGGKLSIELANVYLDQEYASHHIQVTPGHHVLLSVSDTGSGMSRDVQQRIFEPFYTTKEPGKGTGLGLSTVYGIVKQSGGHIWVYSEEGVGTKFKIYLPRVDQPIEQPTAITGQDEAPGGTETVLLVEDDDSVRNMVLRILRDRGYDVVVARDGREALLLCEKDSREFQLLLTDVVMPKMSGRDLADQLQRLRPKIKILYMSGYPGDAILHHGVSDDNVALIEKPFTMDELLRRVREVLARA